MPSLNVMGYIKKCMESVLAQTLEGIEVICVDAGSTDGTLEYLRSIEASHPHVRVLLSPVKSYGYQMNLGLSVATGEYVGIVETDDWIEPGMYERLWSEAHNHDVDIVKCNYNLYTDTPTVSDKPVELLKGCDYERVFNPLEDRRLLATAPGTWCGLYRRAMLEEAGIRYNETPGASYQDASFHFMVCSSAKTAYLVNEYFHHYRQDNAGSSIHSANKVFCICDEMHYFEQFMDERPQLKASLERYYMALKYEKYRWNFSHVAPEQQWSFLEVAHGEFAQHEAQGLLDEENFTPSAWTNVQLMASNPIGYFTKHCKAYATRPRGDALPAAQVLKSSTVEQPDASIVIPLFNDASYLADSVGSALAQTHANIEVIAIDDGSSDETLERVLQMAEGDTRITVLHQVNEGLSAARNHAMDAAKGRYLLFLDGDDRLEEGAVARLVAEADAHEADLVYFDGTGVYDTPELRQRFPYYEHGYEIDLPLEKPITGIEYYCRLKETRQYRVSACMAMYRASYLKDAGIRFIEGLIHEDNAFTFECMVTAQRVWHVNDIFYLRSVHDGSLMTSRKTLPHLYGFFACAERIDKLAQDVPFDARFHDFAGRELHSLADQLYSTYKALDDKASCRAKLTGRECAKLDFMIGFKQKQELEKRERELRSQLDEAAQREQDIVGSVSFRTGRVLTAPLRAVRDLAGKVRHR